MKRLIVLILSMILFVGVKAQGTNFRDLNFEQACKAAIKEKKMVFVDFCMSGCPPCQMMKKNVFPMPQVGKFYNKHFVSVNYNTTINKEANELSREAGADGFPFYGWYDPKTKECMHAVGGRRAPDDMIRIAKNAMSEDRNAMYLWDQYNTGNTKLDFLIKFHYHLEVECHDREMPAKIFKVMTDNYTLEEINAAQQKFRENAKKQ